MPKKKTKTEVKIDAKKQAQFYGAVNIENWTTFGLGNVPINVAIDKLLRIVDVAGAVEMTLTTSTWLSNDLHALMLNLNNQKEYGYHISSYQDSDKPFSYDRDARIKFTIYLRGEEE